ncbi:hypothetical protein CHS0354_025000 [Potamilus streckersoni]|uniref:Peptidase M12B domain-containing protein n=1 Tax=Potamilus streckersoni TaxID=2493646 RepID=A0AAE0SS15_9BIVA|nr:hypothetical protein CHS0354_025000 [Potamilus streckersoni]
MNDCHFIVLFCTVAVLGAETSEFVWLRDLNNDARKRHLNLGLSDELRFQLNRGEKSINLHLKENPHVRADTDMYVVEALPDGTRRAVKEPFTGKVESKYYHDIDNSAAFTVRCVKRANGPCARTLEGSLRIGNKYFHIDSVSYLSNVDGIYMNREYHDTPHVIREEMANHEDIHLTNDKIEPSVDEEEVVNKRFLLNLRRSLENLNIKDSSLDRNKRATNVYGVELLVTVDPPVWQKFYALANNDTENAMNRVREYVSQVINGVALTYKSIKGRSFSIDITLKAITVVKNEADGPYEKAKLFKEDGMLSINDLDYLSAFADWVVEAPGIPSRSDFDVALMLTGYNLIGSSGISYLRTVCTEYGVAITKEMGYFHTMIVASHELGHNLGADHDSVVGCPRGNIMWMNLRELMNQYSHMAWEFSKCSIDAFEKTLAQNSCVKDEATFYDEEEYDNYNKFYPGQIYSPEDQCKIAFGQDSYICSIPTPDKICVSLKCYNPQNRFCSNLVAADGTQCGTGNEWCIDGLCVSKQNQECEDLGYMDLTCADIRSSYSSKSKFCSKWSLRCCDTCSNLVTGQER